ncbi:MAG TPA: phenylalanine--tRNA ligase subunit beta, partial [Terriglobia bacterium]|nr:phenylalanine--tRNA ligase subunit beta [Terriglobia bacterium]
AREVAARYGLPLTIPAAPGIENFKARPRAGRRKDDLVEIIATDLCPRYSARLIRGVEVKPSPEWLARRLELAGVRAINNVADATNYALLAYGHPMHAFDLDRLEGGRIVVRRAEAGERLTTLDGTERVLTSDDLVIADARRAVALAGVMGGQDTEISTTTKNVLLESAWFDPVAIRRTAKRQGLHTEASHRFERGADIEATLPCAARCIELIRELAGGQVDPALVDAYPRPAPRQQVLLHRWELARHLGVEIPAEEIERILYALGFHPRAKGRTGWICLVPSYRVDVAREIDLVEEVARHYGYDRFPLRLPAAAGEASHNTPQAEKEERLRSRLLGLGYDETISLVLVSRAVEPYGEAPPIALSNPLSEEAAVLRTSLVPGLLEALQWNQNRGQENVQLFEIGNLYLRQGTAYREPPVAALAAMGDRVEGGIDRPASAFSFYDIKGDVEQLVGLFAKQNGQCVAGDLPFYYRPGHSACLLLNGQLAARFGQLHPEEAERRKLRRPVFLGELFLETLYSLPLPVPQALPLSRFPAVERDFSVVLPDRVAFDAVRQCLAGLGLSELIGLQPVEIFRGGAIEPGHYSLLLRVTLQRMDRTLTEAELSECSRRIIQALQETLGATIRRSE